jgi:dephospho-CoA kinase
VAIFALTGGIAAGKSTVAARLSELGAYVISADELARFVQRKGSETLKAIVKRFGMNVLTADGELNRAELGKIIFGHPDHRVELEAIVHPAIQAQYQARTSEYFKNNPAGTVVYDIPLLIESGRAEEFDGIIVLACPAEIRRNRLISIRGLSPQEADSRIAAQATEEERIAIADWVIDTSGTIEKTLSATDEVWLEINSQRPGAN